MKAIQDVIIVNTLTDLLADRFEGYTCHAYCYAGYCTFSHNGKDCRMEQGDCLIVPKSSHSIQNIFESDDFQADAVYVTREFLGLCTPQSNYGTIGHMSLFENPIMKLTPDMQQVCSRNFATIKHRMAHTNHHFRQDALMNAIQCMMIDFFDFHVELYGINNKVSLQQSQLMLEFVEMLERGDMRQNRDIGYYADKLCVTPKYLSEVSKKVSGLPANYWITRYTSFDISRQLRDRSLSLTDISDMFGFTSLSHFSRYVVNNLGAKPSELRE